MIFTFGIINCGRDLFGTGFERYPGDLADTRFNNVILEHDYQWLIGNQENLWDLPFFYPQKNMLAGSDNHLGSFWLYVPFRLIGLNETRSFQWWVFCLFALNFFVFYNVARKLGLNVAASSAGAFLFTFSMPVLGSVHHIQTLCKFTFPLVIYFFYKILFVKKELNILYFTLSLIHVFYCSLYYGMFTVLILAVFFFASLFFKPSVKSFFTKKNIYCVLASIAALALFMIPLLKPYLKLEHFAHHFTYDSIEPTVPHPYSYLMPHPGTFFYAFMFEATKQHTEVYWMHSFFIGFISLALVFASAYFLWKYRKQNFTNLFFILCGITLSGALLLTSAAGKYSIYRYFMEIKSFSHLKAMNRIILLELFFMGMLVAWMINRVELTTVKRKWITSVLVFGVCFEHFMVAGTLKFDTIEHAQHNNDYVNKAIAGCKTKPEAFVVLKPYHISKENFNEINAQIDGMMSALQNRIPTLNGYSTVVDPRHFNVHFNDRPGVNAWLFSQGIDTPELDKKILIIR
ncbi:MAG TPA: hypothetical protein VD905_13795 [Flavobacteriales bacterium]|nr:hypothetical protein [Flavobacteriales bacterium]